jgi:tetratricopeptide (TPR) repeat protein
VPIYDVGRDETRPVYTKPFIEGRTLQAAIDAFHGEGSARPDPGGRGLRLRELLQHFIAACNTVAYAHDRGVVHRDLKPSNLMLGPYGETLVMDWGLARRFEAGAAPGEEDSDLAAPGPSPEDLTATGEILGTPKYMSPEQARGEPAGPAGDIFSLGLVLYAILTGKSAFDESSLRGPDRLKAVREAAIVPPRRRDPRLPRALEAVCLKALAARTEDRYPSARALGEDLTRWLADEPVTAWREPFSSRARRWMRRHRSGVTAAVAALFAAVIGLAAVAAIQARARSETDKALARALAEEEAKGVALAQSEELRKQAEAVSTFLVEAFRSPDPSLDGRQVKVADVLDRAGERLDRGFAGSRATRGALLAALGLTYHGLGLYDRAAGLLTKARDVREAALGPDHPDTLTSRKDLAITSLFAGRPAEAIELLEGTLRLQEARLGPDHPDAVESRSALANAYLAAGRTAEAIALHEGTLRLREARLGPDHPDTLQSRNNLAMAYAIGGRPAEAVALHKGTLGLMEAKHGPDHPDTLACRNNLAIAYAMGGRPAEAIELFEGTLRMHEARLGPDHPDTLGSRNNLAATYLAAGRPAEAIELLEGTLRLMAAKLDPDHPDMLGGRSNLAEAYLADGRTTEAIALHEGMLRLREARLGPDHPDTLASRSSLAAAYLAAGRPAEAIALHEGTLRLRESMLGPDHPDTLGSRAYLADAYSSSGRWAEAEGLYREVLIRRRKAAEPDSPHLAEDLVNLGRVLLERERWSEVEPLVREAMAIRARATPDDWRRYEATSLLGGSLLGQGRYADAEPSVVAGYEGMRAREARIAVCDRSRIREAAERVIRLYEARGRPEEAAAWKTRAGMPDLPADVFARP